MAKGSSARIGEPLPRVDALAKVTGIALFPSDVPAAGAAYAVLLTSTIALGRISRIDSSAAEAVPGFLLLLSHENVAGCIKTPRAFAGLSTTTVETDQVMHDGQIIGLIAAESYESACEAAACVRIEYEQLSAAAGFDSYGVQRRLVKEVNPRHEDPRIGDADSAYAAAPVRISAEYETPIQHHNPIELLTTTCWWSGDSLIVHEPSQFVLDRSYLADCFSMPVERIRVISRYCGGGFGGKTSGTPRTALCALASRRLNRPVKLLVRREQAFTINTYRAETRQHVRLAADRDGQLLALIHEGTEVTSRPSTYSVAGTEATARMYACANIRTSVSIVHADRNTPGFMRCPAEVPYMFALESAMDELAHALRMDPIALRRRNDTGTDPVSGLPFSSRSLMRCFDEGAREFGWSERPTEPGGRRLGDWRVGYGCATACYPVVLGASAARVSLDRAGAARVQLAFHEIGNGAYTVIAQAAAAALGISIDKVTVELGDTALPPSNIAAASNGTATTCNAVTNACMIIRDRLVEAAKSKPKLLACPDPVPARLVDGCLIAGDRRIPIEALVERLGDPVEAQGTYILEDAAAGAIDRLRNGIPVLGGGVHGKRHVAFSFGAHFVEVHVHMVTGQIRLARVLGVFAAGTIMNRRTATAQLTGGMIWGVGSALHEATIVDPVSARYINRTFADYLIPVNADVPSVRAILLEERDEVVNPMGIKGLGELGPSGMNAAIANAIFNATARRLRSLPILPRHLI